MVGKSLRRWVLPPFVVALAAFGLVVAPRAAVAESAWVQPELAAAAAAAGGEPVPAVVLLDRAADLGAVAGDHDAVVAELKRVAGQSQAGVRRALPAGVTVRSALWIVNALVVELPAANAPGALSALSTVPGVTRLLSGAAIAVPELKEAPAERQSSPATGQRLAEPSARGWHEQLATMPDGAVVGNRAWGIERLRADRVWDELGVTGAGTRVAVVDAGVDLGHPDLAGRMATDDPADPAYPGGWIQYGLDGAPLSSRPGDDLGNGTALSSVVVGGAASGTAIGVAPGAKLMHAKVTDRFGTSLAALFAGLQWTIEPTDAAGAPAGSPADVVTMRYALPDQYRPEFTQATRAVVASGAIPVFAMSDACGNGRTEPGLIYEAVGVGSTDRSDTVPDGSCGRVVNRADWPAAPGDWPSSFVKPDLTAPGVDVPIARWRGGHDPSRGSAYATAYVAGVVALMRAAAPEAQPRDVVTALRQTAVFDERHGAERPNVSYGAGRVDALTAVRAVAGWSGVTGRVVDARTGLPVASAQVRDSGSPRVATTDADGRFRLPVRAGARSFTVSAATYAPGEVQVDVPADGVATADVGLAPGVAGALRGTVGYGARRTGVPGATVLVTDADSAVRATTDAEGRYQVPRLEPGEYQVSAAAPGLLPSASTVLRIAEGATAVGDLLVRPPSGAELVSVGMDGAAGDANSRDTSVSADGRFVAFASSATNLVPGEPGSGDQVYVRDRQAGTTELVSVNDDRVRADGGALWPTISADGRFVAFASSGSNLVPDDTNRATDVFLRDRETDRTILVTRTEAGDPGNGSGFAPVVSADGRHVAFGSSASDLVPGDTNRTTDVFVYDTTSGAMTLVSHAADGGPSDGWSGEPDVSEDGSRVAFSSQAANLVPGDTDRAQDVFVTDLSDGSTVRVSQGEDRASSPSISGDGGTVAFDSDAAVLVHDLRTARTVQASVNTAEVPADDLSEFPSLSRDGRYVAFRSYAANLYAGDVNGASDVFVRDLVAGTTEPVFAATLAGDVWTNAPDLSPDGRFVSLNSEPHSAWVGVGHQDVYVVDRQPPDERGPRFALSGLTVGPDAAPRGAPVTVRATVTNIGDEPGSYAGELRVDGSAKPHAPVSLAPGAAGTLTWTVSSDHIGSHDLRLGRFAASFRVRPPLVTVRATTVDGLGGRPVPLRGAAVSLVQNGFPVPFGVTDEAGQVTAEVPVERTSVEVTAIVSTPPARRSPGYLLTAPVRVDGRDVEISLTPRTGRRAGSNAAVLELVPDRASAEHDPLTYLSPAQLAPAAAVAMPPGQVVVSTGEYRLRHAYRVGLPEREWWALSVPSTERLAEPRRYKVNFGGAPTIDLNVARDAGSPTAFTVDWSVVDGTGVAFDFLARGPLRYTGPVTSPALPSHTIAFEVPALVQARAPRREDVVLRVFDPTGTQVAAGGLPWDQHEITRDLANWVADVPPGEYRVELTVGTADSPFGPLTATATVAVEGG
ncbi:carboxypeptidase regulatory-like domain-containing protein [Actinophytocola sp. NPDC049390]|uniref:carboxypeptidase regulatory-like domain-containing protein n=1 Tax=Actinophytocola sp. NPDC049390 TaxID=3363894 RepID=UPI0037AFF491